MKLKLNPEVGDRFTGRPWDSKLLIEVTGFGADHVFAVTVKNKISMHIPFNDWNRYVSTGTIIAAPKSDEVSNE